MMMRCPRRRDDCWHNDDSTDQKNDALGIRVREGARERAQQARVGRERRLERVWQLLLIGFDT